MLWFNKPQKKLALNSIYFFFPLLIHIFLNISSALELFSLCLHLPEPFPGIVPFPGLVFIWRLYKGSLEREKRGIFSAAGAALAVIGRECFSVQAAVPDLISSSSFREHRIMETTCL